MFNNATSQWDWSQIMIVENILPEARQMPQWLKVLAVLQKTGVWLPRPTSGRSQPPLDNFILGNLMGYTGLHGHLHTYAPGCAWADTYMHTQIKIKIFKICHQFHNLPSFTLWRRSGTQLSVITDKQMGKLKETSGLEVTPNVLPRLAPHTWET